MTEMIDSDDDSDAGRRLTTGDGTKTVRVIRDGCDSEPWLRVGRVGTVVATRNGVDASRYCESEIASRNETVKSRNLDCDLMKMISGCDLL
ncbi:hypothetical protein HanRHA438_Chr05g0234371 [Helianthus annuus]|nr:hypothetical protein HanRHA438_Chr05g0234371 [Helianthus annuus]